MRKRKRVQLVCDDPSLTKQQSKDECDINKIIRRHGAIPPPVDPGQFIDTTVVNDYFSAMQIVTQAQQSFAMLPSEIRERFANDPGNLVAAVETALADVDGNEELVRDLVGLDILDKSMLDQFGIPAEPGDKPPVVSPPPPAESPPADS